MKLISILTIFAFFSVVAGWSSKGYSLKSSKRRPHRTSPLSLKCSDQGDSSDSSDSTSKSSKSTSKSSSASSSSKASSSTSRSTKSSSTSSSGDSLSRSSKSSSSTSSTSSSTSEDSNDSLSRSSSTSSASKSASNDSKSASDSSDSKDSSSSKDSSDSSKSEDISESSDSADSKDSSDSKSEDNLISGSSDSADSMDSSDSLDSSDSTKARRTTRRLASSSVGRHRRTRQLKSSKSSSSKSSTTTSTVSRSDHLLECSGHVAAVYGDPHITTFDGVESTCQAGGEFTLAKSADVHIQGKFEKLDDQSSSVLTGVAVEIPGVTQRVQVGFAEYDSGEAFSLDPAGACPMHLYLGATLTPLDSDITKWRFDISKTNSSVNIQFHDGTDPTYALTLQAFRTRKTKNSPWFCAMTAYICAPSDAAAPVGLLGTPDDDDINEWMASDGTPLTFSSDPEVAYDYATTNHCITQKADSLFYHEGNEGGKWFMDLMECDAEFPGEVDTSEAGELIVDLCGANNTACIIDGMCGGEEAAVRTLDVQEKLAAIKSSDTVVDMEPDTHCIGDISLLSTEGNTPFDEIPFTIVSQDTTSVTLKLRSLWFEGVNTQYTQYSENFAEKCIATEDVTTASLSDEITVSCVGSERIALVNVIGSDDSLDMGLDVGKAPHCCHADDDDRPKVKYTFMVSCVSQCIVDESSCSTTSNRRLRGGVHYD